MSETSESNSVKAIKLLIQSLSHEALVSIRMCANKQLDTLRLEGEKSETDNKIDITYGENEGYAVIVKSDAHLKLGCTAQVAWYSSSSNLYGLAGDNGSAMRGDCIELISKYVYDFLQEKNDLIENFLVRADTEDYSYTPK
jgi:hypothetical protein